MTTRQGEEDSKDDIERISAEIVGALSAMATPLPDGKPAPTTGASGPGASAAATFDLSGPWNMLENGARFVAPVLPAEAKARYLKALILRALRIITRDQTVFNSAILESLRIAYREIEQGIGDERRLLATGVEHLEAELEKTRGELGRTRDGLEARAQEIAGSAEMRFGEEIAEREALRRLIATAETRLDVLEREADRRGPEIDQTAAAAAALADEDRRFANRLEGLEEGLRAVRLEWTSLRAGLEGFRSADTTPRGAAAVAVDPSDPLRAGLYMDFEEAFRGSEEEIGRRQARDVSLFAGAPGPVADLGCGRGEFLAALEAAGIAGIGCDANPMMAARGREKGLAVERADLFEWLSARPDGSLGGVVAYQVVEHLTPPALFNLVEIAARKLAPGGRLLFETVNPESVYAMKWFWMDLTHVRPIPAPSLARLLSASGFRDVTIEYRSPVPADDALPDSSKGDPAFEPIARLLFAPQDIAVTGVR